MRALRLPVVALLAIAMSAGLAACAPSPEEQRSAALAAFVEAERATIPTILSSLPGLYSELEIYGEVESTPNAIATVRFTYTYLRMVEFESWEQVFEDAPRPSWEDPLVPRSELETAKAELLRSCEAKVLPAMRSAGLEGPLRVEYVYLQPSGLSVSWEAHCESAS